MFTVEQWQESARGSVQRIGQWFSGRAGATSVYAALSGLALWPVVEYVAAAAQSGQPFPYAVYMALGSVAGGVGSNLIATQLQAWYEQARAGEVPAEQAVIGWVQENLPQEELRAELDVLVKKFEAIATAQAALPTQIQTAFLQTLAQELKQWGNYETHKTVIVGSGAYAEGAGSKALGQGAVNIEGGNVAGNIITGTGNTVTYNYGSSRAAAVDADVDLPAVPANLRHNMIHYLNVSEIKTVVFDMGIDYESLAGETKVEKVISLIQYVRQRKRVEELLATCATVNGAVDWQR